MFEKIEPIVLRLPEVPTSKVISSLSRVARSSPKDPGPVVAMAFVAGFAKHNLKEGKRYLDRATRMLKNIDIKNDPELMFSDALHRVLVAEYNLMTMLLPIRGERDFKKRRKNRRRVELESQKAQDDMAKLIKRVPSPDLARTLHGCLQSLSWANSVRGKRFQKGERVLDKMRKKRDIGNLAMFFEIYTYRRARRYPEAARLGKTLERRLPRSSLVKRVIGNCYHFAGDFNAANRYLKKAVTLAPQDASVHLDFARVLANNGQLDQAERQLALAKSRDQKRQLSTYIRETKGMVGVLKRQSHRFN